ncbi:MAG: SAM-dependent DNA methyltransferase [Bacteroides sp.]|nr:SAM-dependent DNA methyltransferase [Bacteroides sp.]
MNETHAGLSGKHRQIKSKERVSAHGEVFTAPREVNAMLNLVKQETERIDSRFLEPACGNGNFLAEILERKLRVVKARHASCRTDYELQTLTAVSSIYGIDIQQDNVAECRDRLFGIFLREYASLFPLPAPDTEKDSEYLLTIRYILHRNILWGDALTLCTPDEARHPIVFSEWSAVGQQVKRRDFTLDMLLRNQPMTEPNLFSDLGDEAFIPTPFRQFPLTHYLKLYSHEDREL